MTDAVTGNQSQTTGAERDPRIFSISLSSGSVAENEHDAFGMFCAQMATGHVSLSVYEVSPGLGEGHKTVLEEDNILDIGIEEQAWLGIELVKRALSRPGSMSAHSRMALFSALDEAMGLQSTP